MPVDPSHTLPVTVTLRPKRTHVASAVIQIDGNAVGSGAAGRSSASGASATGASGIADDAVSVGAGVSVGGADGAGSLGAGVCVGAGGSVASATRRRRRLGCRDPADGILRRARRARDPRGAHDAERDAERQDQGKGATAHLVCLSW